MKSLIRNMAFFMSLAILSGCATVNTPPPDNTKLHIHALIDGSDTIMIRGDQIWFIHHAYELPGQWGGGDTPVLVNGEEWKLEWVAASRTGRYIIADKAAALPLDTALTPEEVVVVARGGWGRVEVLEYPSEENKFTLAILVDDRLPEGPSWYDLYVCWDVEKTAP